MEFFVVEIQFELNKNKFRSHLNTLLSVLWYHMQYEQQI